MFGMIGMMKLCFIEDKWARRSGGMKRCGSLL
jgi:hypothetical protein